MRTIKSLITNQRSDGLLGLARLEGLEPPTGCLEGTALVAWMVPDMCFRCL